MSGLTVCLVPLAAFLGCSLCHAHLWLIGDTVSASLYICVFYLNSDKDNKHWRAVFAPHEELS